MNRYTYEVNEHGHVFEVVTDRRTGRVRSRSMVYGLDTPEPYVKWGGERWLIPEESAKEARKVRSEYRVWAAGYGVTS